MSLMKLSTLCLPALDLLESEENVRLNHQDGEIKPSYICDTKRPAEISFELGSVLQIKHSTPASEAALTRFRPCSSSLAGLSFIACRQR